MEHLPQGGAEGARRGLSPNQTANSKRQGIDLPLFYQVWRFPSVTGANGGVFVLFCILFLMIMGAPVLTTELAVGRVRA